MPVTSPVSHAIPRLSKFALVVAVLCGVLATLSLKAERADAYYGWNNCKSWSAQKCYVGNGYHGIIKVHSGVWFMTPYEMCAKAATAAGNIRTGSGCNYNTGSRTSLWSDPSPLSGAYGYWGGGASGGYSTYIQECSPGDGINCGGTVDGGSGSRG